MRNKTEYKSLLKHETKFYALKRFSLVLFLFLTYFVFISLKYGVNQGLWVSFLSWSFFVLCTPIADAGLLIDFPFRLLTGIRMLFSEMFVWLVAISLNTYTLLLHSQTYNKTGLLTLFKQILTTPIPFWFIIVLSLLGTFLSIRFSDELMDKIKHRERELHNKHKKTHRLIIWVFLFAIIIIFYKILLTHLGINF